MRVGRLLLAVTFIESFGCIFVERGVYFFTHDLMRFSDVWNLLLALAFGVAYVAGALASHAASRRWGERRVLLTMLAGQMIVHLLLAAWPVRSGLIPLLPGPVAAAASAPAGWSTIVAIIVGSTLIGTLNGMKWPVIESYVSAGQSPEMQARSVGVFNLSWSVPVVLSLLAIGPLVGYWPAGLFLVPAAMNALALAMSLAVPERPVHLASGHVESMAAPALERLKALLASHRWLMLASYAALFLLAPLIPGIFDKLGISKVVSPALSSVMDLMRVAAFVVLSLWAGWHGRSWPIAYSLVALTAGLFLVLFGGDLAALVGGGRALGAICVIVGEVIFGLSAGLLYYGALYYAMVVTNASVEGGGAHEGLIGSGFAIGPLAGLISVGLQPMIHSAILGTLIGVGPVLLACYVLACVPLWRARRRPGAAQE